MVREHIDPVWIVLGVVLSLVVVHPRVLRLPLQWLGDQSAHSARTELHYGRVLSWLFLYACVWLVGGLVLFGLIETLYPLPLDRLPQVIGAWSLSGLVAVLAAVLPVGLGLRELALSLLLANIIPEGIAVVIAILARLLFTLYEVAWVLLVHRNWAVIPSIIRK
jgi:hypothetical protein